MSDPDAPDLRRILPDAEATDAAGRALAATLNAGDAVMLRGDLGAGKSALARAAITALLAEDGREEDIPSPSFTLVQVYETARGEVWHADLHRLPGPDAVIELGLEDAFEDAVCFVEWPDRLGDAMPPRRLDLALDFEPGGEGRLMEVHARGAGWEAALAALTR